MTGTATPTHVYPTAATYTVTLTITDNTASTDVVNHNVSPNFGTGNPVAAFTANCTGLSCAFDGSTSTDTGGTITTYSWNFGDGSPVVTGASPTVTHVYAAASFYVPSLKVTDNTSSVSTVSTFLFPGSTGTPHAAFTSNCTALSCAFNGTVSTDAGGVAITGYSWNFGDGTTGTGAAPDPRLRHRGHLHRHLDGDRQHVREQFHNPQCVASRDTAAQHAGGCVHVELHRAVVRVHRCVHRHRWHDHRLELELR